jgi:hypothetical protein
MMLFCALALEVDRNGAAVSIDEFLNNAGPPHLTRLCGFLPSLTELRGELVECQGTVAGASRQPLRIPAAGAVADALESRSDHPAPVITDELPDIQAVFLRHTAEQSTSYKNR